MEMHGDIRAVTEKIAQESEFVSRLIEQVEKVIVGQRAMIEGLLVGLLCGGHVLLEGVPGLAKTLAVKTLSDAIQCQFKAPSIHTRFAARRLDRNDDFSTAIGRVHAQKRTDFHQYCSRR